MKNVLITICARGGSKGIPGKNIKIIDGKPLISYTISHAKKFAEIFSTDIGLSTDSLDIKKIASEYGLETSYLRKSGLASDNAGKLDTIADLLNYEERKRNKYYDYILDLDVTSPLRTFEDLKSAFVLLKEDQNALNIFSVSNANRNPYFNMVEKKENDYFSTVKSASSFLSRQSAPEVFDMNASFYFYRREYFELGLKTAISKKSLIYKMDHVCFDLDDQIDFIFMEYLIKNNLLGFKI